MNVFSSITEESFSYLINEYGFSEPVATDGSWKTTFFYEKSDIAIEIELNYREMDAFVYMIKLENGKLPNDHESARKMLEVLINVEPVKSNGDHTTIQQFEKGITNKSTLLKNNLNEILKTREKVFL
ncbi:hypothetical protein KUV80_11225 [Fictibacillus nanhaiensis]|uniref:hypothetical protein n=1 Tax=Fictibacillus nanhaiensis TaxID=742169 RepID=UPI001C970184|nr:hypothetical protein [Fictibacillus nanhaiensis]MBY6037231.1 hypothetical protein [Fictibacillus nanhaiensis]